MLVLSRKPGECVVIDGRIKVKIVRLDGDVVKLGIEAPADVPIHRQEVYDEIQLSNQQALQSGRPTPPRLNRKSKASANGSASLNASSSSNISQSQQSHQSEQPQQSQQTNNSPERNTISDRQLETAGLAA